MKRYTTPMKVARLAAMIDTAPATHLRVCIDIFPRTILTIPVSPPPDPNRPAVNRMADPKAFLGPAQGPPPIARRPTGKARSESQESHIPVLYLFRMISLRGATEVSGIFKV